MREELGVPLPDAPSPAAGDVGVKEGQRRWFLLHASCCLRLAPSHCYLLMGQDGETRDAQGW